jgi:hypothetical protein
VASADPVVKFGLVQTEDGGAVVWTEVEGGLHSVHVFSPEEVAEIEDDD